MRNMTASRGLSQDMMPFRLRHRLLLMSLGVLLRSVVVAGEPLALSGPERVSLIELYTSEGCSSCPPADRWLGALRSDDGLWTHVVPVAFHVTYWDNLGWPDRFASADFTRREYAYAARWGSRSVYTPCFVRDGSEWRPSEGGASTRADRPGVLRVVRGEGDRYEVRFSPSRPLAPGYRATVALLGGGIVSRVKAGENSGSTLGHEFVVVALQSTDLAEDGSGGVAGGVVLQEPPGAPFPRLSVAAWIEGRGSLEPLQAAGGWLRR